MIYIISNIHRVKVTCIVKLKFALMEWFFLKFGNTNQVIQNLIPKFRQSSIISKKPDYLSDYLSIYLQPPQSLIFFAEILHTFST